MRFLLTLIPLALTANYTIVHTNQTSYYSQSGWTFEPSKASPLYHQDASYQFNLPAYKDNGDGTVSDLNTGLMWQQAFVEPLSYQDAVEYANDSKLAGYSDWRIPSIKELYSLIDFSGQTGMGRMRSTTPPSDAKPYMNSDYFEFEYGKKNRYIDAQYWTRSDYTSTTMNGSATFFGVNFADGRIKGYPKYRKGRGETAMFYLRLVRGNSTYGVNDFIDQDNGSIYDRSTKLLWTKEDSKRGMNWKDALSYCTNLDTAGVKWRLPNAKELQSIVDYSRSPDASDSAAIDPIFDISLIQNEGNRDDYPSFWSSTTHLDGRSPGDHAVYIAFGRALGYMKFPHSYNKELLDVHGAGAQRSDPKSGDASRFSGGRGPQGDVVRINNYVRCVALSNDANIKKSLQEDVAPRESKPVETKPFSTMKRSNSNHSILQRFDQNRDGAISKDEAPRKMRENFQRHDLNADGLISTDEELSTLPKPKER